MYIFAGHGRKADVHEHLLTLADSFGFTLEMHEFDLLRDEKQNLLDEDFWTQLKKLVLEIRPFCVIATPPCSTYSRARNHYDKKPGPRPIRSKEHPRGFPWLSQKALRMQGLQSLHLSTALTIFYHNFKFGKGINQQSIFLIFQANLVSLCFPRLRMATPTWMRMTWHHQMAKMKRPVPQTLWHHRRALLAPLPWRRRWKLQTNRRWAIRSQGHQS